MLTLELFILPGCASEQSAVALAKKAVAAVPGVKRILRRNPADRTWAQSRGIFISPTFVLEGEICIVGEPRLGNLISH
ncbi:MAG: hypothetical protein ACE5GK_10795 [Nitrospiria bacterium]